MKNTHRFLTFAILASLVIAWTVGLFINKSDTTEVLKKALPSAASFDSGSDDIYIGYDNVEVKKYTAGFVAIRSAHGYAGPVTIAVGMDNKGTILNTVIVRQTESPAFFRRLLERGYPAKFKNKKCTDKFTVGKDVDSVTGATVSLEALAKALKKASSDIAVKKLSMTATAIDKPEIKFGIPEIVLILLIVASFTTFGKNYPAKKFVKWTVLAVSILFIGFVYKWPVSLISINSLIVGYWPQWHNHIYWYVLAAVIILPVVLKGKTPYCTALCPFGATQEILLKIGGKRRQISARWLRVFRIIQRLLAWIAVICALLFRNPAVVSYDISPTFFTLIGQNWHFVLLALILILSLFVGRPWCNCLCPLRAVFDYIRLLRASLKSK